MGCKNTTTRQITQAIDIERLKIINQKMLNQALLTLLLLPSFLAPAYAHEYWIEPTTRNPHQSQNIELIARVGEGLDSERQQQFSADSYERLWINGEKATESDASITDDKKALIIQSKDLNTTSVAYQEKPALHRYSKFEDFVQFANEEGVEYIVDQHIESDLPKEHFFEQFTRHTKTLFCSSSKNSIDSNTPIDYDWIAWANVHNPETSIVQLQLLKADQPLASRAVTVFAKYEDMSEVTRIRLETDDKGVVSIANRPGRYLINSTVVHKADREVTLNTGAIWESHWVSLTFENQCV